MWNITAINNAMRALPSGKYTIDDWLDGTLYKVLKARLNKHNFNGSEVTGLVQSGHPFTGRPFGEGIALPQGGTPTIGKWRAPIFEQIATAWITKQAMDKAKGMPGSEINAVRMALKELKSDWDYLSELATFGDGTGRLARVKSVANSNGVTTVTCDNTYLDSGIENVQCLKNGLQVEIYAADGTQRNLNSVAYGIVTGVSFGNRQNSATPVDGTFTYASSGTDSIADGDIVYLRGTHSSGINESTFYAIGHTDNVCMPVGLLGLIQDADTNHLADGGTDYRMTTFQALVRASYPTMYGRVVDGSNINSGTPGTPGDWDLSVLSDVMTDCYKASGAYVDVLFTSSRMASCINRLQPVVINANDPVAAAKMASSGGMYASKFLRPDGKLIPIEISQMIPDNCVFGVATEHLSFEQPEEPDFFKMYGDIWGPTKGDGYAQFEAPFGGYMNFTAERCDGCFVVKDLKTNL